MTDQNSSQLNFSSIKISPNFHQKTTSPSLQTLADLQHQHQPLISTSAADLCSRSATFVKKLVDSSTVFIKFSSVATPASFSSSFEKNQQNICLIFPAQSSVAGLLSQAGGNNSNAQKSQTLSSLEESLHPDRHFTHGIHSWVPPHQTVYDTCSFCTHIPVCTILRSSLFVHSICRPLGCPATTHTFLVVFLW